MKQSEVSHHARRCQATDVMHMSLCEKYDALEACEMQNSFKHTEYDSNVGMLQDQCWRFLFFRIQGVPFAVLMLSWDLMGTFLHFLHKQIYGYRISMNFYN